MVTKCANPNCNAPFHYLRGGRLYSFELRPQTREASSGKRSTVYFWICEQCSDTFSLEFDTQRGVILRRSWESGSSGKQLHCNACSGK